MEGKDVSGEDESDLVLVEQISVGRLMIWIRRGGWGITGDFGWREQCCNRRCMVGLMIPTSSCLHAVWVWVKGWVQKAMCVAETRVGTRPY